MRDKYFNIDTLLWLFNRYLSNNNYNTFKKKPPCEWQGYQYQLPSNGTVTSFMGWLAETFLWLYAFREVQPMWYVC